ncbi:MAG: hypothetical protein V8Q09_01005 [Adlercreutzia sp.]
MPQVSGGVVAGPADALDWAGPAGPGAADLGYPSGSTLRNWIKADPRHDPDKCQYRSSPCSPS